MSNLKNKTIKGVIWSFVSNGGRQISQFVFTAILARLLSPDDFGLLGMMTVFTQFAIIFCQLGLVPALIQKQDVEERHLSTAFWVNVLFGVVLTVIFILGAPLIAAFYDQPALIPLLRVISASFVISSLGMVQHAILMKDMDFKRVAGRDIAATVLGGIVGILMALNGGGVWSLVGQFLTVTLFNTLLFWYFSPWRPSLRFDMRALKEMMHFSLNTTGFQISNYIARNIDYLLIGKFLGPQALGWYTLAYKLMLIPLRNISHSIAQVAFPAFAQIQKDLQRVRTNYLKMIKAVSLVTFPMMLGLFAVAPEFILTVYGDQWVPVIRLIQVLCFCGLVQSVGTTVGTLYQSQGRPDIQLKFNLFVGMPTTVLAVMWGIQYGVDGVALFYTIRTFMVVYVSHFIANQLIGLSWKSFFEAQGKSLIVALGVAAAVGLTGRVVGNFMPSGAVLSLLLWKMAAGVLGFMIIAYVMNIFNLKGWLACMVNRSE